MANLTTKTVDKLIRLGNPGLTSDGQSLYLKVTKTGNASWIFRFKLNGRSRDMGLGSYPEVSLAQARDATANARRQTIEGIDPLEARKTEQAAIVAEEIRQQALAVPFRLLSSQFIESHKPSWKSAKHAQQWENTMRTYAYPVIGDMTSKDINTDHVLKVLTPIWQTKTETANRVRNRIELILDAAKARGLREGENPARWRGHLDKLLPKPSKVAKVKHHAAMPWTEVQSFMRLIATKPGTSFRAIEMTIMSACRTSEVLNATWDEVDLEARVWTIPDSRMKAGQEHRVPINNTMAQLLEKLPVHEGNPFIFPGMRKARPLSNMAMTMALRGLGYNELTMHGFRSTFRDWAGECTNHPRDVCEQALAHSLGNKVEAAYRRGDLFSKRARLMKDWADFLYAPASSN